MLLCVSIGAPSGTLRRGTMGRRSAKNAYMNTTIIEPPSPTHVRQKINYACTCIFQSVYCRLL